MGDESTRTVVTREGVRALLVWLFTGPPVLLGMLGAAGSVALSLYGSMPTWAVVLVGVAAFLTAIYLWNLSALYRAISPEAYYPAHHGWRFATTVHLFQAACLLEDVEPQSPLPRRAVVWWHQLGFAMENGELNTLPPPHVKADSRIPVADLKRFAEKRGLRPRCLFGDD